MIIKTIFKWLCILAFVNSMIVLVGYTFNMRIIGIFNPTPIGFFFFIGSGIMFYIGWISLKLMDSN